MADRVRVVYADENALYRTRLLRLLATDPLIELVAVLDETRAAVGAIAEHRPAVALLNLAAGDEQVGLRVAEAVAELVPPVPTRILLLASLPLRSTRETLQVVGLGGVVDRHGARSDVVRALHRMGEGQAERLEESAG